VSRTAWRYLPFEPLYEVLVRSHGGVRTGEGRRWRERRDDWATNRALAELAGTSTRQLERWKAAGRIRAVMADRVAVAIGMHPAEIWGDQWWALASEEVPA
jgi:lambda repressor-like predicted transcriptional regulator